MLHRILSLSRFKLAGPPTPRDTEASNAYAVIHDSLGPVCICSLHRDKLTCLATHPGDSYTAVVRHSHSSRSGIGPVPAHGGNRAGEWRNTPKYCCIRPAPL